MKNTIGIIPNTFQDFQKKISKVTLLKTTKVLYLQKFRAYEIDCIFVYLSADFFFKRNWKWGVTEGRNCRIKAPLNDTLCRILDRCVALRGCSENLGWMFDQLYLFLIHSIGLDNSTTYVQQVCAHLLTKQTVGISRKGCPAIQERQWAISSDEEIFIGSLRMNDKKRIGKD